MKEVSGIEGHVISVGLEGMRGHRVIVEANVRDEKEACIIIGLPDAPMKDSKERILSCLHTLGVDVSMKGNDDSSFTGG